MKSFSALLIIREMQVKTIIWSYDTSIKIAVMRNTENTNTQTLLAGV